MISVYTVNDIDYSKNGAAVLQPTSCTVTEEAGAQYEAELTAPLDARGAWRYLTPGNILRVPCPVPPFEAGVAGEDVDIYTATSSANVYVKPIAPQRVTYPAWDPDSVVPVAGGFYPGVRVTYGGQNYESQLYIRGDAAYIPPPQNPQGWQAIANYTSGAAVLLTLAAGEEVYLVEQYNQYWLYIQTAMGLQGYVQTAYVEYTRTQEAQETPAHTSKTQLFRIYSSEVSSADMTVTVRARHVSYDLGGNMAGPCAVQRVYASAALARLRGALLFDTQSILSTNIPAEGDTYTGDFSYKNPVNALLDPDTGLVSFFRAKLLRDNWDLFMFINDAPDRGVRLRGGVNLLGVTTRRNAQDIITRVMPAAQKADGSALTLPEIWVDSPIIDSYPVIYTEYLKVDGKVGGDDGDGGTWTESALLDHMRDMAARRFSADDADKVEIEIDVDFTLLGDTAEYAPYRALQKLYIYDTIHVTDEITGLDVSLQVASYTWDAVLERYQRITLGSVHRRADADVSGYNLVNGSIRYNKLSDDTIAKIKEAVS